MTAKSSERDDTRSVVWSCDTQSGGANCGADKGLADVHAAGFGPLVGLHELGECWELSVVAEL